MNNIAFRHQIDNLNKINNPATFKYPLMFEKLFSVMIAIETIHSRVFGLSWGS